MSKVGLGRSLKRVSIGPSWFHYNLKMSKYLGISVDIDHPSFALLRNNKVGQFCYKFSCSINTYTDHNVVEGDVIKSPVFYLGDADDFETHILLYPKGHCKKDCQGKFCVYIAYVPMIDGLTDVEGKAAMCVLGTKPRIIRLGRTVRIDENQIAQVGPWRGMEKQQLNDQQVWGCCSNDADYTYFAEESNPKLLFDLKLLVDLKFVGSRPSNLDSKPGDMKEQFGELLESGDFTDVTLIADGKKCKVHKVILAARSPVFRTMFQTDMSEKKSNTVEITDMRFETLQGLVHYMYTDEVPKIEKLGESLLSAAEKYELGGLKVQCEEVLGQNLTVKNAAHMFLLADLHRADNLKIKVVSFIKKHGEKVFETDEWKMIKEDYPMSIIKAFF